MENTYYFSVDGLCVGYNGTPLIDNIRFAVPKGKILSLIGPNGAGKTTILKHILRQMEPLGGSILMDGQELHRYSSKALAQKLSAVLTQRIRPELMSCEDVVATGRYPYTGKFGILSQHDREIVHRAMERVHVLELKDRPFERTSDGQKQRVMLARAICQEPEIIILDEPTAYLDIRHKIELLDILRKMAREDNITVIMTLHEIDLAAKASDLLLCVTATGNTVFGTPEDVMAQSSIAQLYGLEKGSYNSLFGSVELAKPEGAPEIFVIGGGGYGIPFYRRLQKKQVPFAAGILYENDIDYVIAKDLASEVITSPAFTRMTLEQYETAAGILRRCKAVLDAGAPCGELNCCNRLLLELAEKEQIPIIRSIDTL